jgi:dihydroorotate dehydrogenase (NAD+) catalytic subunit
LSGLEVELFGVKFNNPVMVASGTFGYGQEFYDVFSISELGGFVTKTITLEPRSGNPPPRIVETSGGILNSIGLANVGLEEFVASKWPWILEHHGEARVIVNIGGKDSGDYARVASRISNLEGVDAIEINLSCPNVEEGGAKSLSRPGRIGEVVRAVCDSTGLPVISKLSPNMLLAVEDMACEAVEAGSSAISLINTIMAMEIDVEKRRPILGNVTGGLSGPAILPIGLYAVRKVSAAVDVPVIGIGGISCSRDVLKYILAGSSAVQVGTANFVNPLVCREIISGLADYIKGHGLNDITALKGGLIAD